MSIATDLRKKALMDQFGISGGTYNSDLENPDDSDMTDNPFKSNPLRDDTIPPNLKTIGEDKSHGIDMRDLYQDETDAKRRFDDLLTQYPKEYHPSMARGIIAGGIALGKGGAKEGMEFLDKPHEREVEDWKNKAQPYYEAANLERQGNINNRTLAYQTKQTELSQSKLDETERKNREYAQIQRDKNAILDARNRGTTFYTRGARIIALPKDGSAPYDTGIDTTNWSPIDLEIARETNRENLEDKRQGNRLEMEDTRQGNRVALEDVRQPNRIEVKETSPGATARPPTPAGEKTARNNRFQAIWDSNSELRPWLIPPDAPGKDWQLKPAPVQGRFESTESFQNKLNGYNRAKAAVLGTATPGAVRPAPTTTAPSGGKGAPPPSGIPSAGGVTPALRQKAIDFLKQNGLPITDANIQHAISSGRVR